jgi:hypothetical protein
MCLVETLLSMGIYQPYTSHALHALVRLIMFCYHLSHLLLFFSPLTLPSRNPIVLRVHPNSFTIFSFDLNKISMKFLFNIQQLFHHKSKHYETNSMHPYSPKAFQTHQKCNKRHCGLGDFNVTNKQNKQITFLHYSV